MSTFEFVRLLEAGIVPVGVAVGARYEWLAPSRQAILNGGYATTINACWAELGSFWGGIRNDAIRELRADAARTGNGVLAHTHFGQIVKREPVRDQLPPNYLGRWIVVGTVVDTPARMTVPFEIRPVVDLCEDEPSSDRGGAHGHEAYRLGGEKDGAI